jgi:hypothetical protein
VWAHLVFSLFNSSGVGFLAFCLKKEKKKRKEPVFSVMAAGWFCEKSG